MSKQSPDIDVFPIGVVEHSGRNYWIWKIGWMLTALLGVLSLGSAVLFLGPAVSELSSENKSLIERVAAARDVAEQTRQDLVEATEKHSDLAIASQDSVQRDQCRNRYDLAITEALIRNTVVQNNFVSSLAGVDHGATIQEQGEALAASNAVLEKALLDRNDYEANGAPLPCPSGD